MLVYNGTGNIGGAIVLDYQKMFVYNGIGNNGGAIVLHYQENVCIQWNRLWWRQ